MNHPLATVQNLRSVTVCVVNDKAILGLQDMDAGIWGRIRGDIEQCIG